MKEPGGRSLDVPVMRRFMTDLLASAAKVPTVPVSRVVNVAALRDARAGHPMRPSWSILMMKAFAAVAAEFPCLRRAYLPFPRPRLHEHPYSSCALAIERNFLGEPHVFIGPFRNVDRQTIPELQTALNLYRYAPVESIGAFRQAIRVSRMPLPLRRLAWWSTLNVSGPNRAKRMGTFGLSSYGSLGAESLHPLSPLTSTLTFGPISPAGDVTVKLVYDHRTLDGSTVARALASLDRIVNGPLIDELSRRPLYAGPHFSRKQSTR